jgi:hypothetical protein
VVEKLKILRGLAPITIPQLRRLVSHLLSQFSSR